MKLPLLAALFLLLTASPARGQGSLTPPGAPAPLGRTLTQIEPRTDINALTTGTATAVVVLSTPGAYYLTANLTGATGKDTIVVTASGVSIDLNGFSLVGTDAARAAILATSGPSLMVRNGRLIGGSYGIRGSTRLNCSGLIVEGGSVLGILGGSDSLVERCQVVNAGISVSSRGLISDCSTTGSAGITASTGSSVTRCNLFSGGLSLGTDTQASHCSITNPPGVGIDTNDRAIVRHCNVAGSALTGINVGARSRVEHCAVTSAVGVAANNDAGFAGNFDTIFDSCQASLCQVQGFFGAAGAQFRNCTSTGNTGNGFTGSTQCRFVDCTSSGNSALGFFVGSNSSSANRSALRGCIANTNTAGGIYATGLGAIVERCVAMGNSGGAGIRVDTGTIRECEVRENLGGAGIRCSTGSTIVRNASNANGVAVTPQNGFLIEGGRSRVEGNHAYNNTGLGFEVLNISSTNSVLVIGNSAGSNDLGEFVLGTGNAVGPVISPSAVNTNTISGANFNL